MYKVSYQLAKRCRSTRLSVVHLIKNSIATSHQRKLTCFQPVSTNKQEEPTHFYRRILPETCVAFSSDEGKKLFKESLMLGYANIYFPLAEQFNTQAEPAYCGVSSLVMVLNALAVDPKRIWKGSWRWYHEEMLDCCLSLDLIQQEGITLEQFVCLAACNSLDLNVIRVNENEKIEDFRETVKSICSGDGSKVLTCTYSRRILKQTGDGHFSPIGAYHPEKDMLLIMDVARFKYPPHWIKLELMWEAMHAYDKTTNQPRGYILMKKTEEFPLLLFRLSTAFRVTIATHNLLQSNMAKFLGSWTDFLRDSKNCSENDCVHMDGFLTVILNALNESLASLLETESVFTTQFNTCCLSALPKEHVDNVMTLLTAIEQTSIYKSTHDWVQNFERNNSPSGVVKDLQKIDECQNTQTKICENGESRCEKINSEHCEKKNCCRINRIGKSLVNENPDMEDFKYKKGSKCASKNCSPEKKQKCNAIKSATTVTKSVASHNLVTNSHFLTMLLLSWPYEMKEGSLYSICLSKYIQDSLKDSCHPILLNEVSQLRQQIVSLLVMIQNVVKVV